MICPHCHRTIAEQQRYLMSADPDAELPEWATKAIRLLVLFVVLVAVFYLAARAFGR